MFVKSSAYQLKISSIIGKTSCYFALLSITIIFGKFLINELLDNVLKMEPISFPFLEAFKLYIYMTFGIAPTLLPETQTNRLQHFSTAAHKKINYISHCATGNEKLLHAFSLASVICRSETGQKFAPEYF